MKKYSHLSYRRLIKELNTPKPSIFPVYNASLRLSRKKVENFPFKTFKALEKTIWELPQESRFHCHLKMTKFVINYAIQQNLFPRHKDENKDIVTNLLAFQEFCVETPENVHTEKTKNILACIFGEDISHELADNIAHGRRHAFLHCIYDLFRTTAAYLLYDFYDTDLVDALFDELVENDRLNYHSSPKVTHGINGDCDSLGICAALFAVYHVLKWNIPYSVFDNIAGLSELDMLPPSSGFNLKKRKKIVYCAAHLLW